MCGSVSKFLEVPFEDLQETIAILLSSSHSNLTLVKFFKTADQMPDPKIGQMNLQEELRLQMEDKKRRAAAEKAREREEEAKLERRIQEQQDRMRKEFEEEQAKKKAKEQAVSLL